MDTNLIVLRHRVDWASVLDDLCDAGISGYRLANILGMDWPTIRRWREGSEPSHSRGVALLEVHARFCGEPSTKQRICEASLVL
jgi:hypothetical protein